MAMSTETTMIPTSTASERVEPKTERIGAGLSFYRGRILDQLPGAVFAAVTLVWILASFGRLSL
jgi:hypothetical protein